MKVNGEVTRGLEAVREGELLAASSDPGQRCSVNFHASQFASWYRQTDRGETSIHST
jgi:hypothetical protein